jgi:hypothetical protein
MTDTAIRVTTRLEPRRFALVSQRAIFLGLGLACVVGCRLALYAWMPDRSSDFDSLYNAAVHLLRGQNPYSLELQWFPYPLPAVMLAVPFTAIPLGLARPIFDVLLGWAFVYALWRYRGRYALLALASGAYLYAMANGQTTPLMVAASLIPVLGFLLAVKPNTSASLWISRPSWMTALGAGLFLIISLVIMPSWPRDWYLALPLDNAALMPPVLRPFGFLLLLAALRWRSPEGRLVLAMAVIPQSILPHELVSLALIPANLIEMAIYVVGSWVAVLAAAGPLHLGAEFTVTRWTATLGAGYLPMLYLVLRPALQPWISRRSVKSERKTKGGSKLDKERRRAHRLDDDELRVDLTANPAGGVVVKVTHLPTKLSASETGPTREAAERKAQDKLAAIVAEKLRGA